MPCSEASRTAMATQQIHQWLNAVWAVVAEANRYFAGEAPWALAKTDPARQKTVLYVTAEVVRQIAILAQPVMPESCGEAARQPRHPRRRARLCRAWRRDAHRCRARRCRRRSAYSRAMSSRRRTERFESRCSSTATAISIFLISPRISTPSSRAPRAAGIGRIVTISTRVQAARRAARDRRALSERLLLGRHPSASRR